MRTFNLIRRSWLALFVFWASVTSAAGAETSLVCEFKKPLGQEADQKYVVNINFDTARISSTQFVSAAVFGREEYIIHTANENFVQGVKYNDQGRLSQTIRLNRLTAEMTFARVVYDAQRDNLWNDSKQRKGGFDENPVTMSTSILQCKSGSKQF